jgi:hypothetical protein
MGPGARAAAAARRFATTAVGAAFGLLAGVFALIVLSDPYGTGRFAAWSIDGTFDSAPRFAHAARVRDARFDSAIIGNSTAQLLAPERLNDLTGHRFVQLTVPGSTTRDAAAILDAFARAQAARGSAPAAVVIGVSAIWCDTDPALPLQNPFPFWLYDADPLAYLGGLFRMGTMEVLPRRLLFALGRTPPARPDGYWDYERERRGAIGQDPLMLGGVRFPPGVVRPGAIALEDALRRLPRSTRVILLHPPIFEASLPADGSPDQTAMRQCLAAFRAVAAGRPRTAVIDRWRRDALTMRAEWFLDQVHFRRPVAERLEQEIADRLRALP